MSTTYQRFLDLVPKEGIDTPAARFMSDVFIELDGILPDEELLAAAQRVAGA